MDRKPNEFQWVKHLAVLMISLRFATELFQLQISVFYLFISLHTQQKAGTGRDQIHEMI